MRSLPILISGLFAVLMLLMFDGCCDRECLVDQSLEGYGGGQDSVVIDLPFSVGYSTQCVQGAGGSYSHRYDSTYFDVDLDTPNFVDDPVFAPADGMAYVHDTDRDAGFGVHVNLDLGDGTYIVLGHLNEVFVDNASEVAAGQLIGFEGTTGASTGDHVHLGRHDGNPALDAENGTSIEGLSLMLNDATAQASGVWSTSEMTCDLSTGHTYTSRLATPKWHPNGSLVKTPDVATVYLVEQGRLAPFADESTFWSRGYDFADVALIDDSETLCYGAGAGIDSDNEVSAAFDGSRVWLVQSGDRARQALATDGWQAVLKSWGITAATYDDLSNLEGSAAGYAATSGYVPFRDGSLVSETSSSAVYLMSDGIAMPIETWQTYLLLGFGGRTVIEVDDGLVNTVMDRVGDCGINAYCLSHDDVTTCGGPSDAEAAYDTAETDTDIPEAPADTGMERGGASPDDTLSLSWVTPSTGTAERITLSGEYTAASGSYGWVELAETYNASSVTYRRSGVAAGDNLRFSVEFEQGGATSWSCLAPYPPGVVQGTASAVWGDSVLPVTAADDPASSGCGLVVQIPE